jgi:hypothetical protein
MDVLWPDHKPAPALLYDLVDGDQSTAIWQRENQQDPQALSGEVFQSEWLVYVDELPRHHAHYRWLAGVDVGLVDDLQKAAEGDSDFTALAIIAASRQADRAFLYDLRRNEGCRSSRPRTGSSAT